MMKDSNRTKAPLTEGSLKAGTSADGAAVKQTPATGSRRNFLKLSLIGGGLGLASQLIASRSHGDVAGGGAVCRATPLQPKGPFYPIHDQLDKNNDLTVLEGSPRQAKGQVVYVIGQVIGLDCLPVAGVMVEIWQACESGRYNHEQDGNPAPLDPDFQYFGKNVTDAQGRYVFKTILPGAYPNDPTWTRPPHIHFRVLKRGYRELVTQMYFSGDPTIEALNQTDKLLRQLSPAERASVVIQMKPSPTDVFEPGTKICEFHITLTKI